MSRPRAIAYIERLALLLRSLSRQRSAAHGLQPVHVLALDYLQRCNRYSDTPRATAQYLHSTKGTISQSLRLLEQRGSLRRKADDHDRRVVHLRLTPRGRRVLDQCRPDTASLRDFEALAGETEIEQTLEDLLRTLQIENGLRTFGLCRTCQHLRHEGQR